MPRVGHGPATEDGKHSRQKDVQMGKTFRWLSKRPLQERRLNSGLQTLPSGPTPLSHVHISHIYIYIHIKRERERERECVCVVFVCTCLPLVQ